MACRGCSSGDGCECSIVGSEDGVITFTGDGTPTTNAYTPIFHGDVWLDDQTVDDATACADLNDPHIPVLLGSGAVIMVPLPCVTSVDGHFGGSAFAFTFSGTTTDADPGDGFIRLNNATPSAATFIYVDLQDYLATDITDWLDSLSAAGRIRIYKRSNPAIWAEYSAGAITVVAGYRKIAVTYIDGAGAFGTDAGDFVLGYAGGGATGATGPAGPTGVGFLYTFSTTTTDADPGSGLLRFNNATYASVTQAYIDLNAAVGGDVTDWLDSLNDSTNAVKGTIKVSSISDPTKWVIFNLTSTTTVAGYRKLVVTYVDHNGALTTTASDTFVSFSRAGDEGTDGAAGGTQVVATHAASYTLLLADAEKMIIVGGGGDMDITVPLNATDAFPIGTHIDFWLVGDTVTFVQTGGVTIQSDGSLLDIATTYTAASLVKLDTDTWALIGKLT